MLLGHRKSESPELKKKQLKQNKQPTNEKYTQKDPESKLEAI